MIFRRWLSSSWIVNSQSAIFITVTSQWAPCNWLLNRLFRRRSQTLLGGGGGGGCFAHRGHRWFVTKWHYMLNKIMFNVYISSRLMLDAIFCRESGSCRRTKSDITTAMQFNHPNMAIPWLPLPCVAMSSAAMLLAGWNERVLCFPERGMSVTIAVL